MCNHKFKEKSRVIKKKCIVKETLEHAKNDSNSFFDLDYDENGVCLFHSEHVEWKKESNFTEKFELLLNIVIQYKLSHDFSGFQFVSNKGSIVIENKNISKHLIFMECVFHDILIIDKICITNAVFAIEDSLLNKGFILKDSTVDDISLIKTSTTTFSMNNVKVVHGAAMFNYFVCKQEFNIINCYFENGIDFHYAQFLDTKNGAYGEISNVQFLDSKILSGTNFIETEFHGSLTFNNIDFNGNVNFIDTVFSFTKPLTFEKIKLYEHGMIQFRGSNEKKRLFNSVVYFTIDEKDINGLIIFENVNFQNISPTDKSYLLSLQKNGKVEIGKGCIKYRFQSATKEIYIHESHQDLIFEIAKTYRNYFVVHNGLSLGLEIVERTSEKISYFFFSDENISKEIFDIRLEDSFVNFWELFSDIPQLSQSVSAQITSNQETLPSKIINYIDIVVDLAAIFTKVGLRLPFLKISKQDLFQALSQSVDFGSNATVNTKQLQVTVVNHYNQFISGNNNNQSLIIKK